MKSTLVFTLLVFALLSSCSDPTAPSAHGTISQGEYAVLAAIVDSMFSHAQDSTIVLFDSTNPGTSPAFIDSVFAYIERHVPAARRDAMEDYRFKSLKNVLIDSPTSISPTCVPL